MKQSGFRLFLLIWIGSLISEIGSGMTSFALGVYIFQLTGLVSISSFVTLVLFYPVFWLLLWLEFWQIAMTEDC